MSRGHVLVIGAGVTGLTSALFLAEAGYAVTVTAAHVPGDESIEYTSPWAGAHWQSSAKAEESMICDWDVQTYDYWVDMLERERGDPKLPKSGLKMQTSYHYYGGKPQQDVWWAPYVKDFQQLSTLLEPLKSVNRDLPEGMSAIKYAFSCRAPSINVSQYLLYLQEKGRTLGVTVIKARLPTDSGLSNALQAAESIAKAQGKGKVDCFVNATGLGAAKLCGDGAMYPVRGQTVLVKGEAHATRVRSSEGSTDGLRTYCIPRPGSGTTILGGTNEKGVWSEKINPETTRRILERNELLCPELRTGPGGEFEVVSVQCGLRPGREGGPRMERESVAGRKVVHAYGHTGSGYQNSIGSARLVVELVGESLDGVSRDARL